MLLKLPLFFFPHICYSNKEAYGGTKGCLNQDLGGFKGLVEKESCCEANPPERLFKKLFDKAVNYSFNARR
jgi:hypothetical protein